MDFLELIIIIITFIIFPMTIYTICITFKGKFKKGEKDMYLDIILYLICFMLILYYSNHDINIFLFVLSIPLLLAFLHNKPSIAFVISVINILFICSKNSENLIILLIQYTLYFIIYFIFYKKTSKSNIFLVNSYCINTVIFIVLLSSINRPFSYFCIVKILIFITLTYLIYFVINKITSLLNTYKTLNEVKNDNSIKINISRISHEVKNPLVVIKGFLEVLDNKTIIESKQNLLNEINYALDILNDFKDIYNLNYKFTKFNVAEIIKEIKYNIVPFYSNKNVNCIYDCNSDISIVADKKRIKQALINIVKNSVEAIDKDGIIEITVKKKAKNIIIKIKDSGKGMDKETLNNLFTPFYTSKDNGSGLGLPLSKEIIEKHNGTIKYISKPNKYTIAKIIIPSNNKDNKN